MTSYIQLLQQLHLLEYSVCIVKQAKILKNIFQDMDFVLPAYGDCIICMKIQSCRYAVQNYM